ncbi:MAG: Na/Pi cotransporter family protein [Planctomycetales bacterium]|nr:Na/Pi cotransporter family protein [Planctomycetales bacterium]NIM08439.1 Na/Pi cotransporter family protein [Planctomycetales bacterium]NIN07915.1 Na/Pi cotransporter family protein [Planctomycetales bacterium]NIN77045.1 Na/Pi cotransporter family protein [Planctomycetales bacterium]NIO34230.1 Na/Pi cotransporter family protein [Planctomycetales bacterium]
MLLADTSGTLQIGTIAMGLFGGLALFLFGMDQMSDALKLVAGNGMRNLLTRLTTNRFTGAVAGALVTAIIQSSSVTTVLVVGFVSAGLLSLQQSIGVIMGANIGTTVTAQIIAFKVTQYALLLVAVGFGLLFFFKNEKARHYGRMIMGLGLIFFGMQLMSDGTYPLRDFPLFQSLMAQMATPLYGILFAAVFTALVQSSSATTGLVIALSMKGNITLEAGIAMIFGANIGTCITAMLAAIGKPPEAVRAATAHVIFNIAGVALWYAFIPQLAALVTLISPTAENLTGTARLAAETPRQIANAHTVFNVANTLILISFTPALAWLVCRLIPSRPPAALEAARPKYLDELLLQTPSLAMDVVRRELGRLGTIAVQMVRGALHTTLHGSSAQLKNLEDMDNNVDQLHGAVVTYLGRLAQQNLSDRQSQQLQDYLAAANYIESIGDMIETNLVETGRARLRLGLQVSRATEEVLGDFHRKVCWSVEQAMQALVDNDLEIAKQVMDAKEEINRLADAAETHLSRRLAADEPNRLAAFRLESEVIEYLKRMYYFAKRITKVIRPNDQQPPGDTEREADSQKAVTV